MFPSSSLLAQPLSADHADDVELEQQGMEEALNTRAA